MLNGSRILGVIMLVALILAGCGGAGDGVPAKNPPSASKPTANLRVTDRREIEIDGGRIISLSPDGQWLVVDKAGFLCIYETTQLTMTSCPKEETRSIDRQSVAWSPDSARVAFTENFFRNFDESDVWVLEVESGKLTNLTNDFVDRAPLGSESEKELLIDLVPSWSPDSKTLIFTRSARQAGQWEGTVLYSVPSSGGNAEQLQILDVAQPGVVWPSLHWSDDGKKILYTIDKRNERDDPDNGVWIAERDGKNPRQILGMTDAELGLPMLMDVSAQGDKALIWYGQAALQSPNRSNTSFHALLDVETGDVEPVKQAHSEEVEFFGPTNAIFAPDGSRILYTYRDVGAEYRLAVRDVEGGVENVLLTSEELLGFGSEIGLGLNWAEDDTIYIVTSPSSGLLIKLGVE